MVIKLKWLVMAAGIVLGAWTSQGGSFFFEAWTPRACGFGIVLLLILKDPRWKLGFLFVFAFLYGLSSVAIDQKHWNHSAWRIPKKIIMLSGTVSSFPEISYSKYKWEFQCDQFRMEEGPWRKIKSKVEITIPVTEEAPVIGDHLILKGQIRFPRDDEPGATWMKRNFFLKNIQAQIRVKKFGDIIFDGWSSWFFPVRCLQLMRESWAVKIEKSYSLEQSQILKALLLGFRMSDRKIRMVFARSSTSQVLAGANRGIFDSAFSSHFTATAFTKTY